MESTLNQGKDSEFQSDRTNKYIPLYKASILFFEADYDRMLTLLDDYINQGTDVISARNWKLYYLAYLDRNKETAEGAIQLMDIIGGTGILDELGIDHPESDSGRMKPIDLIPRGIASACLRYIGANYVSEGDLKTAQACFRKSAELSPYSPESIEWVIFCDWVTGDFDSAMRNCVDAMDRFPQDYSILVTYYELAEFYPSALMAEYPNPDDAVDSYYDKIIAQYERYPNAPRAMEEYAEYLEMNEKSGAEELYLKVNDIMPGLPIPRLALASCYASRYGLDKATNFLNESGLNRDLSVIPGYYLEAGVRKSEGMLEFADWLRDEFSPNDEFQVYLDNLRAIAVERIGE